MMPEPMTITMDLHQQILAAARNDALDEAADVCTLVIKEYDVMKPNGTTCEPLRVQNAAKGMVSIARQDIEALKAKP
jgi:hypothetical protein